MITTTTTPTRLLAHCSPMSPSWSTTKENSSQ